jgi:hypothetical protein
MINFRFHIVSLTAVLLALGIGLVLGTTFLDDAVQDRLEGELDGLERDLDRVEQRNGDLERQLEAFQTEAAGLDEQLGARLFDGKLQDHPVLVVAPRGIDDSLVERVTSALDQADADLMGTWWLTDRLVLDDEAEVTDLAAALDVAADGEDDTERLRDDVAAELAEVLAAAADVANAPDAAELSAQSSGEGGSGGAEPVRTRSVGQAAPAEPEVLARLREAGFVEYDVPDGDGDVVRLPSAGLRVVGVSGPRASVRPGDALVPMLSDLAAGERSTPVVAVEPSRLAEEDQAQGDEAEIRLVDVIRDDDDLSSAVSTVDDLERVSGRVATILALVDARPGNPRVGHYGTDGGDALLPPPEDDEEDGS